ncbi:hypothetical protein GJW-30_1_01495 [Variibacter gotjawalensis]|uniref:Uncharacterized protein n=1 Tax=Variibacter gotjawalensis TaxID=1333996 RepID=A0A0S3PSM1_9BRAD|nr:permease [Variibacter gotjawalensis]NIK49281.1 ABC-2 type transport system permease protein [Variibacter gotjawalensis]RZS51132.1 ABC-2 type transport system permease protein [Variibacter gotjawalensis]BAT58967.1 hypothetical protein GJW-30_1_01495 [Variibacter gotjawalensis]
MSTPGSIPWLAAHELRLSWRDWYQLLTAGKKSRARKVAFILILFAIGVHGFAWFMVRKFSATDFAVAKANYLLLTGGFLLYFFLMISQAMESATRILYARADLDLIHSSPAVLRRVFVVRLAIVAISIAVMALLLASPFINVLTVREGAFWLSAYGVVMAMGCVAAALAVTLTAILFNVVGARRTRFAAQLVAAIVGAFFIIGLQVVAIFTSETLSHLSLLQTDWLVAIAPDVDSAWWYPARAALGDTSRLIAVLGIAFGLIALVITIFSHRFVRYTALAANVGEAQTRRAKVLKAFRWRSPAQALRRKEWVLLMRDPWLISQSMMQLLYLLPPALLLWRTYGHGRDSLVLLMPVLVMAAGQLAGGLAWLAISGEDAPELVATAPISPAQATRAKVEAVLGAIAIILLPFVFAFALASVYLALVLAIGVLVSGGSATMVQLWFRAQARRAQFHRRQTSSRIATFAEAFSSIGWAGTAAVLANGMPRSATVSALLTIAVLLIARSLAPKPER